MVMLALTNAKLASFALFDDNSISEERNCPCSRRYPICDLNNDVWQNKTGENSAHLRGRHALLCG